MNKQAIIEAFIANPTQEQFIATVDGCCFAQKNLAINHAKTLKDDTLEVVNRKDYVPSTDVPTELKLTADERIGLIEAAQTAEDVEALLEGEKAKTVLQAGADKLELLKG